MPADYGQSIYDLAIRRNLILIGEDMTSTAYNSEVEETAQKQIEEAEKQLFDLAEKGRYDGGFQPFNEALKAAITMAGEAYSRDGTLSGMATGLTDLDRLMGGLQKSDLIIIAGRPGMGKDLARHQHRLQRRKELEGRDHPRRPPQDGRRRPGRLLFARNERRAARDAYPCRAGRDFVVRHPPRQYPREPVRRLVDASSMMSTLPLYIDDTGGLSISQLAARARRLKRQKGLDLLIIDYLQLLSGSSRKRNENRVQELTEITTTLKALAKELEVPIIALSQLSRAVEQRDDKHPQLADLRDSGSIEQDADVVLFIYREEYYLKNKEPRKARPSTSRGRSEMEKVHGRAEVIIGKQRHGPTGTVQLQFEAQFTRFGNLAHDQLPARALE